MNSSQHRCTNKASDSKTQTQQCLLDSSFVDTVGSPLGGQLLNDSASIRPNKSPQPHFTVIYGLWRTTFATSLILDRSILPCVVHLYHGGSRTVHKFSRLGNAP
ncbi:hypothetical protein TNCV_5062811 [Trichonephila clavipes]|nr:hypothetical protein TNCV_5062811 [Trichonephila clavipes]